jgi:dihydrodipicolinate reductase
MKSSPARVLLIGAAGRMGKTIFDLASTEPEIEIVAQCDLGDAIEPAMNDCVATISVTLTRSVKSQRHLRPW